MNFEIEDESMKYKKIIIKDKNAVTNGSTKEHIIFSGPKKVKLSFLFDWSYDKEDGFSYKQFSQFSGHKLCSEEEQRWLENYSKEHYPDGHHMSY